MREAEVVQTEVGKQAQGDGWFVLNVAEAAWQTTERGGTWSLLESETSPFGQFGFCGATEFFAAANAAEKARKFTVPLGLPAPGAATSVLGVARSALSCALVTVT